MNKLLALHGHHGVGKDAIARELFTEHGYTVVSFSTSLWEAVGEMLGVDNPESRDNKENPQDRHALFHCQDGGYRQWMKAKGEDFYTPRTTRYHAHFYGNEYLRLDNPTKWVDVVEARIRALYSADCERIVIPDLRSYRDYREHKMLVRLSYELGVGLRVIRIVRDGCVPIDHESDVPLPDWAIDRTIQNLDGQLSSTVESVLEAV